MKIKQIGQHFVYEPAYLNPKTPSIITQSIAAAFKIRLPKPIYIGTATVYLNWK